MANISVSLPSDGETIDVADYNTPITTIVNDYNGNIDNSNIAAAAAIAGSKLADGGITSAKLATGAGEIGGAWVSSTPTVSASSGTFTSVTAAMRHGVIGKTVHFMVTITLTTVGTGSGIRCTLPVTAQSAAGTIGGYRESAVGGLTGTVSIATTGIFILHEYDNTQTLSNGMVFQCYGTYESA